jgi:hypothetical protein
LKLCVVAKTIIQQMDMSRRQIQTANDGLNKLRASLEGVHQNQNILKNIVFY